MPQTSLSRAPTWNVGTNDDGCYNCVGTTQYNIDVASAALLVNW